MFAFIVARLLPKSSALRTFAIIKVIAQYIQCHKHDKVCIVGLTRHISRATITVVMFWNFAYNVTARQPMHIKTNCSSIYVQKICDLNINYWSGFSLPTDLQVYPKQILAITISSTIFLHYVQLFLHFVQHLQL